MEKFKEALQNCDTVKVILTGVGETQYATNEIFKSLLELERLASYQVPKIVKAELYISTRCPRCKYDLSEHIDDGYHKVNKVKFCPDCGQALKWE